MTLTVEQIMSLLTFYGKDIHKTACSCRENNRPANAGKEEQVNFGQ